MHQIQLKIMDALDSIKNNGCIRFNSKMIANDMITLCNLKLKFQSQKQLETVYIKFTTQKDISYNLSREIGELTMTLYL